MDRGRDKSKPPSASYRETFRRHRKLFCMPVIVGVLAAAFFLFFIGKSYKSTANLWIDTAPPAPSSVGASSSPLSEPPASAEQAILSELLTTSRFDTSVAKTSLLGKSLGSADAIRANALRLLGNGQVLQSVPGGQVLQISYSASSPAMAESVLGALITQLRDYTNRLSSEHARAAVASDREQVKAAQAALATARNNVTAYQAQHPQVAQTDPTYRSLVAARTNAQTQLAQANTALTQATGIGSSAGWSMQVIDAPSQATSAPLRKSKIAEVLLGGALGGLLVSFLAVVILTPAKKEQWEDELPIGGPVSPPMPPADPFGTGSSEVPAEPARPTPAPAAAGPPRIWLGDRHFEFDTPSAPSEEQ